MVEPREVREATLEHVRDFIKSRGQVVQAEVVRLGGPVPTIDYRSLVTIFGVLEEEGLVRKTLLKTGERQIIVYQWIGGK